jgi:hypothetical protein
MLDPRVCSGAHGRLLLGMPLLVVDHLDEALSQFDRSCDDFEMGHLWFALRPGDKAMRQETPAVAAGNKAIRPSGGCASTAFCAVSNYGAGRSDRIGSWPTAFGA